MCTMEGDKRKAELVKELANSICPYLQMEIIFLSNHLSGWMPILDLEVWMAADLTVDWKWHRKPMASRYTILNHSALQASMNRITLVQ